MACLSSIDSYVAKELDSQLENVRHSMDNELLRIGTYKSNNNDSNIFTLKLAKEGFYYEKEHIYCFSCNTSIKKWRYI